MRMIDLDSFNVLLRQMSASLRLNVIRSPVKELPLERQGGKQTSGELQGRAIGSQHTLRGRGTGVGRPR